MSEVINNGLSGPEEELSDKKQIEAEEKEVMLPATEAAAPAVGAGGGGTAEAGGGPVRAALASEEGREVKPKYIPIGGIKMPGFFTRNSDKNKEEETTDTEGDKADETADKGKSKRRRLMFSCPFTQFLHHPGLEQPPTETSGAGAGAEPSVTRRIVDGLRQPLASVLRRGGRGRDPEATLASMETLGDKPEVKDDGMENVKLDGTDVSRIKEPEGGQVATKLPLRERIRQRKFVRDDLVVAAVAMMVVVMVVIISVARALAGPPAERPLRDGLYVTTLTSCGPVEGVLQNSAYNFHGIPYAVPPVAAKRFTYAQPLNNITSCWNGTLDARTPAPHCLQLLENGTVVGEEDCLTLDIVTPHVRYDSPLSVVVLIGANTLAGGIGPLQPSARYARSREVVFVRPNFRLGALGFLALEALSKTKYPPTSGNYGLSDIMVALEWVQLNIKHFGGDPNSVTLLGHRAGATLASVVTSMKKAKKLYTRAWLSSGSVIFPGDSLQDSEDKNKEFLQRSNCGDADCLRRLSTTQILQATPDTWLENEQSGLPRIGESRRSWLVLDGDLVRQHPLDGWDEERTAAAAARKEPKKLVFGSTEHSAHTELLRRRHLNWTAGIVEAAVNESALVGNLTAGQLFEHFNRSYEGLVALISSVRSVCPLLSVARLRLDAPMYVVTAAGAGAGGDPRVATVDADVEAILGMFETNAPEQRRFVAAMQNHFYYFVAHGRLPTPLAPLLEMGQDALPLPALPACDLLIQKDIVPRYARVD